MAPNIPILSRARVLLETASCASAPTKVICVSWELADGSPIPDGEWVVEWDDMYADLSEDVWSARSEQGGYFALQQEQERGIADGNNERTPKQDDEKEEKDVGPLSTARLLEFENGPNALPEIEEDLPAFFATRPIVQAPGQILTDSTSVSKKTEVLFLLAPSTPIPQSIRIIFIPTFLPPNTAPSILASIKIAKYEGGTGLHTTWATKRLEDLQALQEIAKELEREGSRGLGQGRLKVGVEGGGMDEEAVRREGWMVGEEQTWVVDRFFTNRPSDLEAENTMMDPLAGLGINTGMDGRGRSSVIGSGHHEEEEEEEDLFALPLSPRSPDMAMSPFSMFRGEAIGLKPSIKPRNVGSIDTQIRTPVGDDITPTSRAPLTPPRET